jgi:hypothetical protein
MPDEKGLEEQFNKLQELSKQNPDVDVSSVMISALEAQHADKSKAKIRRWVYLASIGLPPIGLFIAAYYYFFSEDSDRNQVAIWSAALTLFSLLIAYITFTVMLSTATQSTGQSINLDQLKQQPAQLEQLLK